MINCELSERLKAEAVEVTCSVPLRRSRRVSLWIGVAAAAVSLLRAAALAGLMLLWPVGVDGAVAVIVLGFLWFGLFFGLRWLKRYGRSLDLRRPGIGLADGLLTVPVSDGRCL